MNVFRSFKFKIKRLEPFDFLTKNIGDINCSLDLRHLTTAPSSTNLLTQLNTSLNSLRDQTCALGNLNCTGLRAKGI